MAEFDEVYYKEENQYITTNDYSKNIHYQKIYCPECHLAPIHRVKKQKTTYFASNRKDEHSENCQHYQEFISNRNLTKLINSDNVDDQERLKFLIDNNLDSAIKNLIKNQLKEPEQELQNSQSINQSIKTNTSSSEYQKESIPRVHIKNLFKKKSDCLNHHIVIWGISSIESKEYDRKNSKTGKDFKLKDLIFREKEQFRFKVSLTGYKISYYKELPKNPMKVGFAVFGFLQEYNGFLSLKIQSTNHLKYLV
jgi:hypothetical protein